MLFILTVAAIFMTTINLAISHFPLFSPQWRGDNMDEEGSAWPPQSKYSCIGINHGPLANWLRRNGVVQVKMHRPSDINFDLSDFKYILYPDAVNVPGVGYFCFQNVKMPHNKEIVDGTKASVLVVGKYNDENDMYNCANITFRANATDPIMCNNDTNTSAIYEYWGLSTPSSSDSDTMTVIAAIMAGMALAFMVGLVYLVISDVVTGIKELRSHEEVLKN
ncbi:hypothetical protein F5Y04DRAFT_278791 [Hypomontagnella monticulosa]|nr:hypothetical protein F5Y04DRAFT_278791 [Hypomontagnella monticulosa]